jgi:tetratricopeptide (TPR) repeat protein
MDYAALAKAQNLPVQYGDDLEATVNAVRDWLENNQGWVLVFDNANSPSELSRYLPRRNSGKIIVTSRRGNWPPQIVVIPLDVWTRADSIAFLHSSGVEGDVGKLDELAALLGDLPLALDQARAVISRAGMGTSEYLELFRQRYSDLMSEGNAFGYAFTVSSVWAVAINRVGQEEPAAEDLLRLLAFLAPDDVPRDLLVSSPELLPDRLSSAVVDRSRLNECISVLAGHSLIAVERDGLMVHRLLQAVVRESLGAELRKSWAEVALQLVYAAFPVQGDDVGAWPECARLLPHALAATDLADSLDVRIDMASQLLARTAVYVKARGQFSSAKALGAHALMLRQKIYGYDDPHILDILIIYGSILLELRELDDAKAIYEQALSVTSAIYGAQHPRMIDPLIGLSSVLKYRGQASDAKTTLTQALDVGTSSLGPDHSRVRDIKRQIGGLSE